MFLRGLSPDGFKQTGVEYVAERRFAGESKYSLSRMLNWQWLVFSLSVHALACGILSGGFLRWRFF